MDRKGEEIPPHSGTFVNNRKQKIFYRFWIPDAQAKAVVFLFHGLGEHSGRYHHVGNLLKDSHYAVFALDHHGHGRSDGEPGYIESFGDFVRDALQFIDLINNEIYPNKLPFFIVGHSMGGAIAIRTSVKVQDRPGFRGAVLSAPAIKRGADVNILTVYAARMMSQVAPRLGVKAVPPEHVSRDQKVVEAYKNDPLVYHGKVTARMGAELLRAFEYLEANFAKVKFPFLVLQGTADLLVHPDGATELHKLASSKDKEIQIYRGVYHELFNEPEKWEILGKVIEWMDARTKPHPQPDSQSNYPPVKAAL